MKNLKKTLKIAGFLLFLALALSVYYLYVDLSANKVSKYNVLNDIVEIVISIVTISYYFVYSLKTERQIMQSSKLFFTLSIVNIFNNFIAWIITFWIEIVVARQINHIHLNNFSQNINQKKNKTLDNVIDLQDVDYSVESSASTLTKRLDELKEMFNNNQISVEEYEKLRQEAIKKYMN